MEGRIVNILLVEDDEVDVMNVKRAFKKYKITNPLYVAGNGVEALQMLRSQDSQPPIVPETRRLILLDLNMPKMNGLEFLQLECCRIYSQTSYFYEFCRSNGRS